MEISPMTQGVHDALPAPSGHDGLDDNPPTADQSRSGGRRLAVGSLLIASPLLFGVPVVLGIVISIIRLLGTRYPDLGWATTVNSDAEELYLGHTLYQNPGHGYTGLLYTPLYPALTSLIYHIYLWNGWPLLLVVGASVSLLVLAARIAYPPTGPTAKVMRILGAAGVGGIAYWCVASVPLSLLDEARADQVAWAFALFGLIAVADFGPTPSRKRVVLAALLLSAGMWTKQTAIGVAAVALAWVFVLAATSTLNRRAALLFAAVLGGVNLALLLVLNILTNGWEFYIDFEMATRQASSSLYSYYVVLGLRSCALAAVFVSVTWLVCGAGATVRGGPSARPRVRTLLDSLRSVLTTDDSTGRRALLLGLYTAVGFVLAVYFLRKQGTETNEYIGVVWALGLLAACGWRVAQNHAATAAVAGVCVALCFAAAQLGPVRGLAEERNVVIPALESAVSWPQIPAELRGWANHHTLYAQIYADLNVPHGGPLYPNIDNIADKLAAGDQPTFLAQALLDRRFEGVEPFELGPDPYTSGFGKWEENYLWKLDEVIAARYVAEPGLPKGVLARRPGPERAAWMRHCFGPFAAGGVNFRIFHGGGFWCSFAPDHLQLVRAPTPLSEVVTTKPVHPEGMIAVSLAGGTSAQLSLVLERGPTTWTAHITVPSGNAHALEISTSLGHTTLGTTLVTARELPGSRREVRLDMVPTRNRIGPPASLAPGTAMLTLPAVEAPFAVVATNGVALDLGGMRTGHGAPTGA
jgi:hypothetical protein